MTQISSLLAWIEARGSAFVSAYVGEGALADQSRGLPGRAPAMRVCQSKQEARGWVEDQAAMLGVRVKWLDGVPSG
jgi:hypothetical protein